MSEKVLIPDEFPVVIVDPKFMVLPSTGSFIFPNEPAEEKLYTDIFEGKYSLILTVMSYPSVDKEPDKFCNVGVVCEAKAIMEGDSKTIAAVGLYRLGITNWSKPDPEGCWTAKGMVIEDEEENFFAEYGRKMIVRPAYRLWIRSMRQEIRVLLADLVRIVEGVDGMNEDELTDVLDSIDNYDFYFRDSINYFLWNIIQTLPECTVFEKQEALASQFFVARLYMVLRLLSNNIEIADGRCRIHAELKGEPYEDRELKGVGSKAGSKGIKAESGVSDDFMTGADPEVIEKYKKYLEIKDSINELAQKTIMREFERLKKMAPMKEVSQEWSVVGDYLDTALELPWNSRTPTEVSLVKVAEVLDGDHYELKLVKNKILRNLAAKQMNPKGKGPILCLVGPPGVGKTSIAESIAKALGRKLIRLSLGGIRDEAEIRGHRSTYIRALMGEIMEGLRKAGVKDPVFVLDEVDKIGEDFRGNPASALLEVLDPEQNNSFKDHYLGFPFDLSEVLFICTANVTDSIKAALLNRMNVIELHGYTEEEKLQIAKRYLLKKAYVHAGFDKHGIEILWPDDDPDELLAKIISGYTRESGVRELERNIIELYEELDKQYLEIGVELKPKSLAITEEFVYKTLDEPRYTHERANVTEVGEAIGLAVTESGCGETMYVHASFVSRGYGDKDISQTGSLLEVFREANKNATSAVKRLPGIDKKMLRKFRDNLLHLSVPNGNIKKDGPSAGITMAMAIYSELTGKLVKPYLGMTGEITIKGRVRAIGGVREKILAAIRDGLKEVILPKSNRRNLKKIPEEIKRKLEFHFVENIGEALKIAFPEDRSLPSF